MASKVNTKFVVILSAALVVAVVGVVVLGNFVLGNKGLRSVKQGDKLFAEGDYKNAEKAYGKAVNKDRTNMEWIEKWHGAVKKITPESQTQYDKLYNQHKSALLTKARLMPTDAGMQEAYIEEEFRFNQAMIGNSREGLERFVENVEERAAQLDPDADGAKRLLRYRGFALVQLMGVTDIGQEKREQAERDLVRALEADPDDVMSGYTLVRWYLLESVRHKLDRNENEAKRVRDEHDAHLDALIAAHPDAPEPRRHKLHYERQMYFIERREAGESTLDAPQVLAPLVEDILGAVEASIGDPAVIDDLGNILITIKQAVGRENAGEVAALFYRVAERYPENAEALLQSGEALYFAGESDKALDVLGRLVGLPAMPVSLDGFLQVHRQDRGIGLQVDSHLSEWTAGESAADKAAALESAKEKLETLRTRLGSRGLTEVLLREARIAVAEERYDAAVHKLTEYRGIVGDTLDAMTLLAHCLFQQGNYGEAKLALEDAIETHGRFEALLARLGEANVQLSSKETLLEAYNIYGELARIQPGNTGYRQRLGEIGSALTQMDENFESEQTNPVVQKMIEARKLLAEGDDVEGALAILGALQEEHPDKAHIVVEYIRICSAYGMRDRALEKVREAVVLMPDNDQLRHAKLQLEADDPVEGMEAVIRSAAESPLEEHLALFQLFLQHGLTERAQGELDSARGLAPSDPRVIEAEFLYALHMGDMDRANAVALRAGELNADQVGGKLFLGRVQFAEERYVEATESFGQALEQNPHNPSVRRLLGECQAQLGRLDEARESLTRSFEARPRDVDTIKALVRVLVMQNRGAEALELTSEWIRSNSSDGELVEMWLTLAAQHGTEEEKERVEMLRRERFQSDPSNLQNSIALITLLNNQELWDESMGVVNTMRETGGVDEIRLVSLEAGVLAQQDKVEEGEALYRGFIDGAQDREDRLAALLSLGRYLEAGGRQDDAIVALRAAREFQDPDMRHADRMLGDTLFGMGLRAARGGDEDSEQVSRGHFADAAEAYESVLSGGLENEAAVSAVQKRLAETYLKLGDSAGVQRVLGDLKGGDTEDLQTLLLRAKMASQGGDSRGAREALDRAAELFPNEPGVFLQRAQLNMGDVLTMSSSELDSRDRSYDAGVVADLKHVTEIRPSDTQSWSLLYAFYERTRGQEAAVQQLREAVETNPDSEMMRLMLIKKLFELGHGDGMLPKRFREEAEQQAKMAAEQHPDDMRWQLATGTVLRESRRYNEAVPVLERTLELTPSDDEVSLNWVSTMLLDCLLQSEDTPEKAQVNPLLERLEPVVMDRLEEHEDRFESLGEEWLEAKEDRKAAHDTIVGMLLVSRAKKFLDDEGAAVTLAGRALGACHSDAALSAAWFDQLRIMFGDANATVAFLEHIDKIGRDRGKQVLTPYLRVVFEGERWRRGKPEEDVLASLDLIEPTLKHDGAKVQLRKQRSSVYYKMERFEESAEELRKGLEFNQYDSEMNNNLAYILVAHLQRYEEALPYAEMAKNLNQNSSPTLDTLGYVYLKLGRLNDAVPILERAVDMATKENERLVAKIHLGLAKALGEDIGGARRELGDVERLVEESPDLGADVYEDLETLRREIK